MIFVPKDHDNLVKLIEKLGTNYVGLKSRQLIFHNSKTDPREYWTEDKDGTINRG